MRRALAACLLWLFSCATAPTPRGELQVDLLRGASALPEETESAGDAVVLVVDLTPSMRRSRHAGEVSLHVARSAARQIVATLPPEASLGAWVLGTIAARQCGDPLRLDPDLMAPSRAVLPDRLDQLSPRAEVSLADTLDRIRLELERDGLGGRHTRVVVLSDLQDPCGGDLCTAASSLIAGGAELQIVRLGEQPAPACLTDMLPPPRDPLRGLRPPAADGVSFRVLDAADRSIAEGVSGAAQALPPGRVHIELALDPPERIGPIDIRAGMRTGVSLLDFPSSDPPLREWSVTSEPLVNDGG